MIDGNIVRDKEPVRIDGSYFIYMQIKPFNEVKYVDESIKKVVLVEITLSTKKIEPKVIIRGEESDARPAANNMFDHGGVTSCFVVCVS